MYFYLSFITFEFSESLKYTLLDPLIDDPFRSIFYTSLLFYTSISSSLSFFLI